MKTKNHFLNRPLRLMLLAICLTVVGCNKTNNNSETSEKIHGISAPIEPTYNIVRPEFDGDFNTYAVSAAPSGVNMTYYSDIYSRGFSWLTDNTITDSDLYIVQSDAGKDADFNDAQKILGTSLEITYAKRGGFTSQDNVLASATGSSNDSDFTCVSHKAHVENLEKGKAYSYKIGSEEGGYAYGAFIVEKDDIKSITAIQMSDAQTKESDKLNVWRNTFTKAVDTAGDSLDMVLYNGDQFDQNMGSVSGMNEKPNRLLRYAKSLDVINDYKACLPYMASSGNHEPTAPYAQYLMGDVDYDGYDYKGAYYSYDYDFAHFVVLNSNTIDNNQINWLKADLDSASAAKWKVVMLHIAPYSTGDHSNDTDNQKIVEKLCPIFSEKHVDLVLQAHDHTYNKTLPYKWDAAGYTTTYNNEDVVNFNAETEEIEGFSYDKNPNGTYYVTTGAAGHRCGASEADGVWAEVVNDNGEMKALNSSKTFINNKYKNEVGRLTQSNSYESYTTGSYTSSQNYQAGDFATGNVNAQMFGVLNLTESTLSYNVYTVNNDNIKLFDTLGVLKD